MTAEAAGHVMWTPDPTRQRAANYTVEDLLSLPDDVPRLELRDGVVIVVHAPSLGQQKIGNRLWSWLADHAPAAFEPATAVGVALGLKDSLEPDVMLLRRPLAFAHHFVVPDQVELVVEIVSPGTRRRDRLEKPVEYAVAGIPHYWRIEQSPVHIFAYDLVGGSYELVADSADELVLTAPFDIRLPVSDITP